MFGGLRNNSTFYILHTKENVTLDIGQVTYTSSIHPKLAQYPNNIYNDVIDAKVIVNGVELEFKQLPANQSIANFGIDGVIVSDNKEDILNEIINLKSSSEHIIANIEHHKEIVDSCSNLILQLDPDKAKNHEYDVKIANLEQKITGMEESMTDVKNMLKEALNK